MRCERVDPRCSEPRSFETRREVGKYTHGGYEHPSRRLGGERFGGRVRPGPRRTRTPSKSRTARASLRPRPVPSGRTLGTVPGVEGDQDKRCASRAQRRCIRCVSPSHDGHHLGPFTAFVRNPQEAAGLRRPTPFKDGPGRRKTNDVLRVVDPAPHAWERHWHPREVRATFDSFCGGKRGGALTR